MLHNFKNLSAILLIAVIFSVVMTCGCTTGDAAPATVQSPSQPVEISPTTPPAAETIATDEQSQSGSAIQEEVKSATVTLTRPEDVNLVNYTEREFTVPEKAAISWWMFPGYGEETSDYRNYLRATSEEQAERPEEEQYFFSFITDSLDSVEDQSVLKGENDVVLFRGVSEGFSSVILDNAAYIEDAYASTSYDITFSLDSFGPRDSGGYANVLVLERSPGDHILYINEDEREFLIPRGTKWQVVTAVNIDNLTVDADFPLSTNGKEQATYDNVRLIYISEMTGE